MKRIILVGLILCGSSSIASAGTLYQWVDESGQTRSGYRPPAGVQAITVGETARKLHEPGSSSSCRELLEPQIRLIDQEIARVKEMAAGFGTDFEFTPEGKQRLINDLLAHRAALITGRLPEEFAAQARQLGNLKGQYERSIEQLRENLEEQASQIRQQQQQLERQRRENELIIQQYRYQRLPY